jgi:hypothetical protein
MKLILHRRILLATTVLLCVAAGGIVAPVWSATSKPVVRFVKAPPSRTTSTDALFRFKTRALRTFCRRDNLTYRRCRSAVKYSGLRPGRHKFVVRGRHAGRTIFVSRTWTVVGRERSTPTISTAPPATGEMVAPVIGTEARAVPAGRRLVLNENFDGTTVDPAAWALYDSAGHAGFGLRRPSAIAVDGQGNLVITASMVDGKIVSGAMANRLDFTYGRLEFRVRTEPDPTGTMSGVVLTWPQNQASPEFTENDIYETGPFVNNTRLFESFIHFGSPELGWQKWMTHYVDPSQWHTIAMEWYPDSLDIYIDGMLAWSITDRAVIPDVLHHVCLQLDARATRTLTKPVRMWVDYVRVWQ